MKKLTIIIYFLMISPLVFADEPSLSEVLEWKYGPVAGTVQEKPDSPKMVINSWRHPTLPVPNEAQIAQDTKDYKDFLVDDAASKKAKKDAALLKLKISEEEMKDILRAVKI